MKLIKKRGCVVVAKSKREKEIEEEIENAIERKIKGTFEQWGKKSKYASKSSGGGSALYCVGFFGAGLYYLQLASGFGAVITGLLKALIWPAIVVYKLLESFYGIA